MSSVSSEGESTSSFGAGDAHTLGTAIQVIVDRLVAPYVTPLESLAAEAMGEEPGRGLLAEAAVRGLRDGVVGHAINGCTMDSFAITVCAAVRRKAAACLRDGRDHSSNNMLDAHFSEPTLRDRLHLPDDDAPITSAIAEMRRLAEPIVRKHYRLAKSVARTFRHPGLNIDELEQEAAIGLRKAALSYRPADGTPFDAYARSVIRRHLSSFLRTAGGATDHFARRIEEFIDLQERLAHEWMRQPSEDEVFEVWGLKPATREKVRSVMRMLRPRGLPAATEDEGEVAVRCPLPDPQQQLVAQESAIAVAERMRRLSSALDRLPHEQREIINLRYYQDLSFTEIGKRFDLTPRQVRTRDKNALQTLTREVDGADSVSRSEGSA